MPAIVAAWELVTAATATVSEDRQGQETFEENGSHNEGKEADDLPRFPLSQRRVPASVLLSSQSCRRFRCPSTGSCLLLPVQSEDQ